MLPPNLNFWKHRYPIVIPAHQKFRRAIHNFLEIDFEQLKRLDNEERDELYLLKQTDWPDDNCVWNSKADIQSWLKKKRNVQGYVAHYVKFLAVACHQQMYSKAYLFAMLNADSSALKRETNSSVAQNSRLSCDEEDLPFLLPLKKIVKK